MNNSGGYVHSEENTVRFMDGQFYDTNWNVVYIPQSNSDFRKFCKLVEAKEAECGRALNGEELDLIVEEASNVVDSPTDN